jgi:bile acid:Na+ symporter, BASS family
MSLNQYNGSLAAKIDKPVRVASCLLLFIIIVGLVIKERVGLMHYIKEAWLIILVLNVCTMLVGFLTAKLARLSFKQAITVCLESGNQNGTLAIHVAAVSLARPDFAIVGAIYSLMMYFTASIPILIGNKRQSI